MRPRRAPLALLALMLLLAGCSRLSLGWRMAPWWLNKEAVRWTGADAQERQDLRRDVGALLHEIGVRVAPKAAAWSRVLARDLDEKKDEQALDQLFVGSQKLWQETAGLALDPSAAWLAKDGPRRAQALEKVFAERARSEAKAVDGRRAVSDRARRLRDGLKDWLGDVREAQLDKIDDWAQRAAYPREPLSRDRQRRELALLGALKKGAPAATVREELKRWWLEPDKDREAGARTALERYRADLRQALAELLKGCDEAQRQHLSRRLRALAEDLDGIARRSMLEQG